MAIIAPECRSCGSRMEEGFSLATDAHGTAAGHLEWISGKPEKSRWLGFKLKGRRRLPISIWRCPKCGWLTSYAVEIAQQST
jgi:hypothetical protein